MRKAQSISINTIVVAAIALVILVVIIVIFSTRIGMFSVSSKSCATLGGVPDCHVDCSVLNVRGSFHSVIPGTECEDLYTNPKKYCCKQIIPPSS
jgi:hypothetical protein